MYSEPRRTTKIKRFAKHSISVFDTVLNTPLKPLTKILLIITAWSVQTQSFFWYIFSCIRTEYRKIRTRKKFVFGHFSRVTVFISQLHYAFETLTYFTGFSLVLNIFNIFSSPCSSLSSFFNGATISLVLL